MNRVSLEDFHGEVASRSFDGYVADADILHWRELLISTVAYVWAWAMGALATAVWRP